MFSLGYNENIPDLPFTCKLIRKSYDFVDRKNWQTKEIDIRQPSVNVQLMATKGVAFVIFVPRDF